MYCTEHCDVFNWTGLTPEPILCFQLHDSLYSRLNVYDNDTGLLVERGLDPDTAFVADGVNR